jgi:cell division protein FtsI (penicillin-binding protein 3)
MASWPPLSLDPDQSPNPLDMRVPALVDVFEPGSTFKLVIAASVLEEKALSPKETFDGENGAWKVKDITIHDHEPLQRMSLEDIIVHSSNIGAAKLAERIGAERLYEYARVFGFGVFPGSGFTSEAKGVLRPLSKWSGVSKYVVAFGQEIGVTGIQMVDAYSSIANGGTLMEPRLVKKIVNDDGKIEWQASPSSVRRVVSPATAAELTRILVSVVNKGTGVNAQILWDPNTTVAGKTGTAQKWDAVHHRYHDLLALVSFCGFFPADKPKLTMLVVLDEPEGRRWGGLDAAPVFRRIAEQIAGHLSASTPEKPAGVM